MLTDEAIRNFLSLGDGNGDGDGYGYGNGNGDGNGNGYGDGDGDGDGYGYGNGYGDGNGDGDGYGYGNGNGNGNGNGYGYGNGNGNGYGYGNGNGNGNIVKVGAHHIYKVDGVPTAIYSIHGNYARGGVLQQDFTFKPCYIARVGDSFAHGDTLRQAMADARAKELRNQPVEERVGQFLSTYPNPDTPIPAKELFDWHNILTGSCLFGRKQFCAERGINVEHDSYTLRDFVKLTKNSYGGGVIRMIEERLDAI